MSSGFTGKRNNEILEAVHDETDNTLRVKSVGQTAGGNEVSQSFTAEGHAEVAIHGPLLPFGSVHTENLTPIFQHDAVYGLDTGITGTDTTNTSGSVTVTTVDSCFKISSGTTIYSQAALQSRRRLRYRPGQGIICRFTSLFTTPVASSYQLAGLGHSEDGLFFGYKNTTFGILYVNRGVREIQTLTINTASSTSENVTITLAGTAYTVAVTNSGNTLRTAYEIGLGTYAGWKTCVVGSTVTFLANSVGNKTGTFNITGTTVVGSFTETTAGANSTETFIPQSEWNGDKLDGTGASGVTLDPTKFNIYQIGLQYLGAGPISFEVETISSNSNNPTMTRVHTLRFPNTLSTTSLSNPSMPFTAVVYSAGSTTDLTVKVGSYAGFIEGIRYASGNRFGFYGTSTAVSAANYTALMSLANACTFKNRANQTVTTIYSIAGAIKHTSPCTIFLFRQAALVGNPSFIRYANNSATLYDSSATTCTIATNDQLIWSTTLGDTSSFTHTFSDPIDLQPGEMLTMAARALTGSPSYVTVSLNIREEQ